MCTVVNVLLSSPDRLVLCNVCCCRSWFENCRVLLVEMLRLNKQVNVLNACQGVCWAETYLRDLPGSQTSSLTFLHASSFPGLMCYFKALGVRKQPRLVIIILSSVSDIMSLEFSIFQPCKLHVSIVPATNTKKCKCVFLSTTTK